MPTKSTDEKTGERIAKVMARAGLASRREAEAWIAAGRVSVNGAVISSPALNVGPADRIAVDGKPLPRAGRTRLFLHNKPPGLVTTHSDPQGRPTIFGGLPRHLPRLISVGRLDINTEGLLLLTNDGGLARALELPQTGWLRSYRVRPARGSGLPSTAMRSAGPTLSAGEEITAPLTETRPAAIHASASRREASPARAITLAMRSPVFSSVLFVGMEGV